MAKKPVEIYELIDPVTSQVRYIGKANDSNKRLKSHIRDSRRRNTPVYLWIRDLTDIGLSPIVNVIRMVPDDEWKSIEREEIAKYRKESNTLLNIANGGDQPYCSIQQRALNGRDNAHKIHSDPFKKRVWRLKLNIGHSLKWAKDTGRTNLYNKTVDKLRTAAIKHPELFNSFLAINKI